MAFGVPEEYLVSTAIGVLIGVFAAKYFYENTRNYSIGKAIEGAMISDNIEVLFDYSKDLERLLSKMNAESDSLLDQIKRCGDIESMEQNVKAMNEGFSNLDLDGEKLEEEKA